MKSVAFRAPTRYGLLCMFTLPKLPYAENALEPHIDAETMRIHHDKHHQAYLDKLNAALQKNTALFEKPIEKILADLTIVPDDIRVAVRNNGGGYYHHSIFWEMMSPSGGGEPNGQLAEEIKKTFGGFGAFKEKFSQETATHFASGWTWLVKDKKGALAIVSTPNQDSPVTEGVNPLLGIDTWEHAYYLKYQNRRPDYIAAWWNVVHWAYVEKKYSII